MNILKSTILMGLSLVITGLLIFSVAIIGLAILGVAAVLTVAGLMAKPFSPQLKTDPVTITLSPKNYHVSY